MSLLIANWKLYKTPAEAQAFVAELAELFQAGIPHQWIICPQAPVLGVLQQALQQHQLPVTVGAQTMDSHDEGAYTGEVSPLVLKAMGVQTVLIGHSERRQYFNETDASVQAKVQAALKHGLQPVVCVGESLAQREAGQTDAVVTAQVQAAVAGLAAEQQSTLIFAYEPIWAIGTGKTCDAAEANRVCGLIAILVSGANVLYGGSVKPENSVELLGQPHIDGALVGGASLQAASFWQLGLVS